MAPWCLTADGEMVAEWHLQTAKALGLTIPPLLQRAAASWTAGSTTNGLWKCIAVVILCCLLAPL